jgi:hypothetical protein
MRTIRTLTRDQLTGILAAVDCEDLAEFAYARRLTIDDSMDGGSSLALRYDTDADLSVFIVAIAMTMPVEERFRFAGSTKLERHARVAYWPGWVLSEPTEEETADAANAAELAAERAVCPVCIDDHACDDHLDLNGIPVSQWPSIRAMHAQVP